MQRRYQNLMVLASMLTMLSACGTVSVTGFQNPIQCTNVSAALGADVIPTFAADGCTASGCHMGASPAGNLDLEAGGDQNAIFSNLTTTANALNTTSPSDSNMLLVPLRGSSVASHTGDKAYENLSDTSYVTIFCWVSAGANNN